MQKARDAWKMSKGDVGGHSSRDADGEGIDLLLDVEEEGVGRPSAEFLDGNAVVAVELESHGSAGPEGVGTDIGGGEAMGSEAKCGDGRFDGAVDVMGCDVAAAARVGVPEGGDWGGGIAAMHGDVVDSPRKCLDRAGGGPGGIKGD